MLKNEEYDKDDYPQIAQKFHSAPAAEAFTFLLAKK
jgi:hypothetical protein